MLRWSLVNKRRKYKMGFVIFEVNIVVFLTMTALSVTTISALTLQKSSGKQLNAAPQPDDSRLSWNRAAGLKDPAIIWPGAVVPYTFSNDINEIQINNVKSAMEQISQETCITFKEHTTETDYVVFELGEKCSSPIGRKGGRQRILLRRKGCKLIRVLHELLHTLGLIHEQSRPDRDRYITIKKENIKNNALKNFVMKDWDTVQNLTVPYDYNSIMQYSQYAFSKNGEMTIVPKGTGRIPDVKTGLSADDIKFINLMYNCNTNTTPPTTNNKLV